MFIINAVKKDSERPQRTKEFLEELSTVPERITELVKSVARSGTGMVLAWAKAFFPYFDQHEIVGGFPQNNLEGDEFSDADFVRVVKETRVVATQMVEELDLRKYQPAYSEDNKRINPPEFKPFTLVPPRRKPNSAPDASSSSTISEDVLFKMLTDIPWKTKDEAAAEEDEAAE